MKHFFTFVFLFTALAVSAADYQLYFGSQPILSGATYETGYVLDAETSVPGLFNTYIQDANVFISGAKGTRLTIEVSSDNPLAVCTFGGCSIASPSKTVKKSGALGELTSAAVGETVLENAEIHHETDVEDGQDPKTVLSTINASIKVYPEGRPFGAQIVKVIMRPLSQEEVSGAGIGVVTLDKDIVEVQASDIHYRVSAPAEFTLYSITGAVVLNDKLSGQGTYRLENLNRGIYIYRLGDKSGKVLVK